MMMESELQQANSKYTSLQQQLQTSSLAHQQELEKLASERSMLESSIRGENERVLRQRIIEEQEKMVMMEQQLRDSHRQMLKKQSEAHEHQMEESLSAFKRDLAAKNELLQNNFTEYKEEMERLQHKITEYETHIRQLEQEQHQSFVQRELNVSSLHSQCKDTMKEYYDRVMGIFDELANTSLEDSQAMVNDNSHSVDDFQPLFGELTMMDGVTQKRSPLKHDGQDSELQHVHQQFTPSACKHDDNSPRRQGKDVKRHSAYHSTQVHTRVSS